MPQRLITLMLPADQADAARQLIAEQTSLEPWSESIADERIEVRMLLDVEESGKVIDRIATRFDHLPEFRLVVLPVEAALPRSKEDVERAQQREQPSGVTAKVFAGISREELYSDARDMTVISPVFIATTVLSTIVASVGMLRNNVAVIIGAMVIAPLLGPIVGLALATTLADTKLLRRAILANAVGVTIAVAVATATGMLLHVDPQTSELAMRTQVSYSDFTLALAAGAAGVLALTAGLSSALVGVMVAVALLPPTAAIGLMLGSGYWGLAGEAALLLATNIICVNLAGIATFLMRGVRPLSWWEADRAKRLSRSAMLLWLLLLVTLMLIVALLQRFDAVAEIDATAEVQETALENS